MEASRSGFRKILGVVLPLAVLVVGGGAYAFIQANPPEAGKRPAQRAQAVPVEATRLSPQDYTITLRSFGSVAPRKQTTLVAQVSGVVSAVSAQFRPGAQFAKGDVLLALDASDHQIAVRSAEAALVQANAQYTEEKVQGDQAASDWKKLGKRGKPSPMLLRTPQRQAARAQVQAAQAQLDRAQLDLDRTQIRAPYDGQVLSAAVDEGRFLTAGSTLGDVFASGALDVRLPLNSAQLQHLELSDIGSAPVELLSGSGAGLQRYSAVLARSEGHISVSTRQMFVVAEVHEDAALTVGQFVEARLSGKQYKGVYVLPERLLRPEGEVYVAVDGEIKRVAVELLYADGDTAVVSGLSPGDVLILTPLGSAVSGMRIAASVDGEPLTQTSSGGSGRPIGGAAKGREKGEGKRSGGAKPAQQPGAES